MKILMMESSRYYFGKPYLCICNISFLHLAREREGGGRFWNPWRDEVGEWYGGGTGCAGHLD